MSKNGKTILYYTIHFVYTATVYGVIVIIAIVKTRHNEIETKTKR